MKSFLKFFIVFSVIFIISAFNITMAANKNINRVEVSDIDSPYIAGRTLDTKAKLTNDVPCRITDVAWKTPADSISGLYEVTVSLEANIGYSFSEITTGKINDSDDVSKTLIDENKISFTYIFPKQPSSSSSGTSNTTLRHRIDTYCDKEKGTITPTVRVLHDRNQTIIITPNEGYRIKEVKVDGESVGKVSEYTFKKVKDNHTISAYFEKIEENEKMEEIEETPKEKPIFELIKAILKLFEM